MNLEEASKKMLAMVLALAKKELLDKVIKGVKGCTPILAYLEDNKEKDVLIGDIALAHAYPNFIFLHMPPHTDRS